MHKAYGFHPDPIRLEVQYIPPITSQDYADSYGVSTYIVPFNLNISQFLKFIRELIKKENKFTWTTSHQLNFNIVNTEILTLAYYDTR